ncbi:SLC13 family permease [Oleispirillum naphthae]|uniref:SLC13 family permease n=1 Tax=Oleispirillum naphthae TaxID=2838853 RepID=UPI0030824644
MHARMVRSLVVVAAVAAAAAGLAALPAVRAAGAGPALVLVLTMLALWATGVLAEYLTAMIFFTAAILLHIAPPEVAFSGFASSAFWLIFSGLFVGIAVNETGLGDRLARRLLRLFPTGSYAGVVAGNAALGVVMAFIMPSATGRILLLLPIYSAIAERLGHAPGGKGHSGLVLAGLFATFFPAFAILPANIPNVVLIGSAEALGLPLPDFAGYLFLHFPVLGFLRVVLISAIVIALYRSAPTAPPGDEARLPPMTRAEWRLATILALALALWCTDRLHGISPAWVGMVAAVACLLPGVGVLKPEVVRKINTASLLYIAAIIGVGTLVGVSGIGRLAADGLLGLLPLEPGNPARNFGLLSTIAALTGVIASQPGIPAVLTPLARDFAAASGLPVATVLMTQVVGFSTVLMSFQAPAMAVAVQAMGLPVREANRLCLIVALASAVLLWPLDYLWWVALGLF